jgi:hypothetical protein
MSFISTKNLLIFAGLFFYTDLIFGQTPPEFRIAVDPGHGGFSTEKRDDKWDQVTKSYLEYYGSGMNYGPYEEHAVMMKLGRKLHERLKLTETDEGWAQFTAILKKFSDSENPPRIILHSFLTREDSWDQRFKKTDPDINDPYRLFDFPDRANKNRMKPGRMSIINSLKVNLAVSLHMTPAGRGHPGGMAAVLSPGYDTFDLIRRIHLDEKPVSAITESPWFTKSLWIISDEGWSQYESARADTWVYFRGYRTVKDGSYFWKARNRGLRHNMVTWTYSDPPGWETLAKMKKPGPYSVDYRKFKADGKFWDRERSEAEKWRREGGLAGFGGDNHYASDELLRFLQYRMRSLHSADKKKYDAPGPVQPPYISAYALPEYINAISAYIEVGFLNRDTDRMYMTRDSSEMADALAAGIYSLFAGLPVKHQKFRFEPKGVPLDFAKYEKIPEGNYFRIVSE